jgi:hypothetical protein
MMHCDDKNKNVILQFHLWLLICADARETIKHEYRGMYSGLMVRVFTGIAIDALENFAVRQESTSMEIFQSIGDDERAA